jgi:hypothetical protein
MAKYFLTFSDGSPELETRTLLDEQDAFSFAKVVAEAMGRDENKPPPEVLVHAPNGAAVKTKNRPLTCMRCHSVQALGVSRTLQTACASPSPAPIAASWKLEPSRGLSVTELCVELMPT